MQLLIDHEDQQGFTLDALANGIENRAWEVWVWGDFNAVLLTNIHQQQNGRLLLTVNMAGGSDIVANADLVQETLEQYARANGCFAMEVLGRKGWERVVRKYGYKHDYTAWQKEL